MKKPIKRIAFMCFILPLAISLAGCGANNGSNSNAAPSGSASSPDRTQTADAGNAGEKATLRFSWWGSENRHKALLAAIDAYEQKYPNITIEPEYSGFDGYYQKLVTQFSGGTAPDLTPLSVDWIDDIAVKGDLVLDLYTLREQLNLDTFDADFLNKYTVFGGKLVGLPMGVNGMVIAYNRDFFDRFGIPEDTKWDWETIHAIGKRVHEQDPNAYLLASLEVRGFLQPYVRQQTDKQWIEDDKTLGFDQDALTDALAYYKKLLDDGVLQPLAESSLYPDITQNVSWQKGDIGMSFGLASTLVALKSVHPSIDVAAYPIPANAKTSAVLVNPSNPLAISKASKHPEEAARFANWLLTDPEAALLLGDVYSVPPVESNAELLVQNDKIDPTVAKAVKLALDNPGDPVNGISGNQELADLATDYLQQVGFGQLAPEQAAQQLIGRLADKLKDIK